MPLATADRARAALPESQLIHVAKDLWTYDAKPIRASGLLLPIRMVIIRLPDGELLLHSPTQYSATLKEDLERLGPIKHLVAPNIGHWLFLRDWQRACPEVKTWAAPGLAARPQVRKAGVRVDAELGEESPAAWAETLDQVLFQGPGFAEVDFFHRPSRTVILTDLALNVPPEALPPVSRVAARLLGITAPHGRTPVYLRAVLGLNRHHTHRAAARLVAMGPRRVIVAHGRSFERNAITRLRHALGWTLDGTQDHRGKAVVVTGASSGIGRATALAFAARGAAVALAARRAEVLEEVAHECAALGGRAIVVPTDVTDPEAMRHLAERTIAAFGAIDIWINNAGVGVFGPFQKADVSLHRRTIEVNLLGAVNGAAAVLPTFLRRKRGTLINNISLGGWAPTPFAAAYTASKFGLRGLTASLRQELKGYPNIHVCGVFPSIVDTPGFVHGANVSGRNLDPGPLQWTAEDVAATFVRVARRPRGETAVGWPARAGQLAYAVAPSLTETATSAVFRALLSRAKPAPRVSGAVLDPIPEGTDPSGGWLARKNLPSGKWISLGLAGALGATAAALAITEVRRSRR